jgi:hypothetical protein
MILIPNLNETSFSQAAFNFSVQFDSLPGTVAERVAEAFGPGDSLICDTMRQDNGQLITVDVSSLHDQETAIVDLQIARLWEWELTRDRQSRTVEEIASLIEALHGLKCSVAFEAAYTISRDLLPARGIVAEMLGLKTRVEGEELVLTGAQFRMPGSPREAVSWFLRDGFSRDGITGKISRTMEETIQDRFLVDTLDGAERRLNQLILEQAEGPRHGICS